MTSPFLVWSTLGPFFTTSSGQIFGGDWALSNATDGGTPIWAEDYTPSATYTAGAALTYTIVLTTQDWLGDIQPAIVVATDTNFINPFGSSATSVGNLMAPVIFSNTSTAGSGGILYWTNSSTPGDYAVDFRPYTVTYPSAPTSSPLTQLTGAPVTMISAIANPLSYSVATDTSTSMVFSYVTANGTGENIYFQGFDNTGAATTGPVLIASGVAKGTPYFVGYSNGSYGYRYLEIGGALGTGFVTGSFNSTTGAVGTAKLSLALPSFTAFTGLASVGLSSGNGLRIIEGVSNGVDVLQAYLSTTGLTASYTLSSDNDHIGTTTVYDPTTGELDYTALAYADAGEVHLVLLDENGDQIGTDLVVPGISSFDRIHTLQAGNSASATTRVEIDYTVADPEGGYEVEGFIYDTSGPRTYTLGGGGGLYDGSPDNDTITWAVGVYTIDGGGGSDTFVATNFTPAQVSISIDAAGEVVLTDNAGDVDTLRRFTTIDLSGATVTISGNTLTQLNSDSSKVVSTYNITGQPYTTKVVSYTSSGAVFDTQEFSASGALVGSFYAWAIPNDFTGDGRSDVLFQASTGGASTAATWQVNDATLTGGGAIGNPGAAWSYQGSSDFYGDGHSDILWRNQSGSLAIWRENGTSLVSGASVGNPGGTYSVIGVGDTVILFEDASGNIADWTMNGATITGGASLGNPGGSFRVVGYGDFNGDGSADILFENASGQYAVWNTVNSKVTSGGSLGSPGAGWVFKGVGNFNGLGASDILFENANTGVYATWDVVNDKVVGGGVVGNPGALYAFEGIGDYSTTGRSSILFENTATGTYATWDLNDSQLVGGGTLGNPGPGYAVLQGPPALKQQPEAALTFFDASNGQYAEWDLNNTTITASGGLGAASGFTEIGVGDFNGDGQSDVLFSQNGSYAIWETNGTSLTGGGSLGSPGGTFAYKGVGDFNGDGKSDILFEDSSGNYATWNLNGPSIVYGASLGSPGSGFTYVGNGDFTGDGTSDLLLKDAAGNYWVSFLNDNKIVATQEIGNPGASATVAAIGDLNGDGRSDILFNINGTYASWDMNGASIVGGGTLGAPGGSYVAVGIAVLGNSPNASVVFENSAGSVATWLMNDYSIIGGGSVGTAAGYSVVGVR